MPMRKAMMRKPNAVTARVLKKAQVLKMNWRHMLCSSTDQMMMSPLERRKNAAHVQRHSIRGKIQPVTAQGSSSCA